jgi:hypothetical protein
MGAALVEAFGKNLVWGLPATIVIVVVAVIGLAVRWSRGKSGAGGIARPSSVRT